MENNTKQRLDEALINFVERASKENATPEEIAVLADVANVLLKLYNENVY